MSTSQPFKDRDVTLYLLSVFAIPSRVLIEEGVSREFTQ